MKAVRLRECCGFTLLEVLLAIALSTGLLLGVLSFYRQVSTVRGKLDERVEALSAARLLMQHITSELQAVPAIGGAGTLVGRTDMLEFTTVTALPPQAWLPPAAGRAHRPATDRKRVSYRLRGPWRSLRGVRRPDGARDDSSEKTEEERRYEEERARMHHEWFGHHYGVEWKEERFPHRLVQGGEHSGGRPGQRGGLPQGSRVPSPRGAMGLGREDPVRPRLGEDLRDGREPGASFRDRGRRGFPREDDLRASQPRESDESSAEDGSSAGVETLRQRIEREERERRAKLMETVPRAMATDDQSDGEAVSRTIPEPSGVIAQPGLEWLWRRGVRVTERIRFLRFRYYDGLAWRDDWNDSKLPLGIEIQLGERLLPDHLYPTEYPYPLFRRIVSLPAAQPLGLPHLFEEDSEGNDATY